MQLWTMPSHAASPDGEGLAVRMIGCIGRPDFGPLALACINTAVAAASWSVYSLAPGRVPVLHASGSFGIADTTADCFRVYADGIYRSDATFDAAYERTNAERHVITHWHASEIGARHGERIYRQHGMRERLSVVARDAEDGLLALNLYRHEHQPAFCRAEIQAVQASTGALVACVRQHIRLRQLLAAQPPRQDHRTRLQAHCPGLTTRELQICDALLRGLTFEGIAAELSLSVATAKTYRNRAFARLGIHFRSELYSLALGAWPGAAAH